MHTTADTASSPSPDQADLHPPREDRYKLFVDQAAEGFYETDLDGIFTFFNDALCRIFGRSRQEITKHNFHEFIDAKDIAPADRRLNQIKDTDKPTRIVWRILHPNGNLHTLDVSARSILDEAGRTVGFRGMVRDITNKLHARKSIFENQKRIKHLYAASREAEQQYHAFLEFLPLPLLVHNLDHSVAYLNPAFEATFGWSRQDLEENPLAHIPEEKRDEAHGNEITLLAEGILSGVQTQRLTKDGRLCDVIHDGSMFYDHHNQPAGVITALRDVTKAQKDANTTGSLFRIAKALHQHADLDSLLFFISQQVKSLMHVRHAHIILADHERKEYYFRAGFDEDTESYQKFSQIRVPLDDSNLAGRIILSGEPRIVNNVDEENLNLVVSAKNEVRNIMGVPMRLGDQIIGAMVVNNKSQGVFNQHDITLLSSIANLVSLPIENTRIHDALRSSYDEIKALNRAKDRIIDHLSHELRTPLAVLSASLNILSGEQCPDPETAARVLARSQRNLKRIMEMQSKIVDITRDPYQRDHQTLSALLDLCSDELESMADDELDPNAAVRIRKRIDAYFQPQSSEVKSIDLVPFVSAELARVRPLFAHRQVSFQTDVDDQAGCVHIPDDVLRKIITGLVRNAVEYTPDGGEITVTVRKGESGPELSVADTGVGITRENQTLFFENYFTTADISRYRTGKPYDFNAGGSGFDLLRMQVFAERYHFKLQMSSERCPHIPTNEDACPGNTEACSHCDTREHCHQSGGTRFTILFPGNPPRPWTGEEP